ncbi:MAG TPA: hypothetical protein VE860_18335 [Chthoniobacterales bacterium]|nr:hypothetical protein [Chthoniobacterales bacterium]
MKTLLILISFISVIGVSGCTSEQSRLPVNSYAGYTPHGYTSPGACAAGRN